MSSGKQQESVCRYFRLSQYVCSWQWVTTWDGLKHHGMPITTLSLWQENIVSQQRLLKGLNDYDELDVLLGFLLLWKTLTKPTWRSRSLFSLHFGVLRHWGRSGQELKGGTWKQGQKQRLCCCLACSQAYMQVSCIHIWSQRPSGGLSTRGGALSHYSTNKKLTYKLAHRPIWWKKISLEIPSSQVALLGVKLNKT